MYDIFYVSKSQGNDTDWANIKSKYPIAQRLSNITSYDEINSKSFTKMFWVIWDDIDLTNFLNLSEYTATKWDDSYVHIFKNGDCYDGICLFPKNKKISKKEFDYRFFIDKKEIDIVASIPKKYKIYSPSTFLEYQQIQDSMFWIVWPEITIVDFDVFNLYFSHHNMYDRRENHTFKHYFNDKEIFINGVILCSKEKQFSHREFKHRFLINKKEHDRLVSKHKIYDVVFLSYDEPNANENYSKLLTICPRAKRVHGIKGIHQAHIEAAKLCDTDMFWVIDGDAVVHDSFNFDLVMSTYDIDCVHVWRSRNPINDLEYGNGGIKLLPRQLTLNMDINSSDMTTSISKKFKAVQEISNITAFNTDEFTTWRSAFRECAKLSSRVIERQHEEETQKRLDTWCTVGADRLFGKYAIAGAQLGKAYGLKNKNNADALQLINNFEWLKDQFSKYE